MAQRIFKGHNDHYNGITIDSVEEACDNKIFAQRLKGRDAFCFLHLYIRRQLYIYIYIIIYYINIYYIFI